MNACEFTISSWFCTKSLIRSMGAADVFATAYEPKSSEYTRYSKKMLVAHSGDTTHHEVDCSKSARSAKRDTQDSAFRAARSSKQHALANSLGVLPFLTSAILKEGRLEEGRRETEWRWRDKLRRASWEVFALTYPLRKVPNSDRMPVRPGSQHRLCDACCNATGWRLVSSVSDPVRSGDCCVARCDRLAGFTPSAASLSRANIFLCHSTTHTHS